MPHLFVIFRTRALAWLEDMYLDDDCRHTLPAHLQDPLYISCQVLAGGGTIVLRQYEDITVSFHFSLGNAYIGDMCVRLDLSVHALLFETLENFLNLTHFWISFIS